MTASRIIRLLPLALLFVGAGCVPSAMRQQPIARPSAVPIAPMPLPPVAQQADSYAGWGEIQPGGVVSLRIPPGCKGDPGAGNIYVLCPTPGNDTPTPDMHVSSDGMQVNIRRWEDMDWEYWDAVVASMKVIQPLVRDVQINIQK